MTIYKGPQRAVFIWADDTGNQDLIDSYIGKAEYLGMDYIVLGPDNRGVEDISDKNNYIGVPTYDYLRVNVFNHSYMGFLTDENPYPRAWIVIFDHSYMVNGQFNFDPNGNYPGLNMTCPYADIKGWLDNGKIPANDVCVVVIGGGSGKALYPLWDPRRIVMCSQGPGQNVPDNFNMAQHLDYRFAWREAFNAEIPNVPNQNPQILPP